MRGFMKTQGFPGKSKGLVGKWGFRGFMDENQGFGWKNWGFIEKRGFHGILVNKSGKSRKEPGI